ncbi:hypothetical protein CerSpe_128680 [Prunus speciosa]
MWNFASSYIAGSVGLKNDSLRPTQAASECSDDESSSVVGREEGLECPICWESFNIVENVPYVLWCGHTLCKNCILGLQWAVVKFPTLPIQLPLFISCPWCNLLSFRLVYRGNLKFPRKNYFLLWMVESMNGDRVKSHSTFSGDNHPVWPANGNASVGSQVSHTHHRRVHHIRHIEPSAILALYILITVVFALPSFLLLYFAYPSLDWLVREIIT